MHYPSFFLRHHETFILSLTQLDPFIQVQAWQACLKMTEVELELLTDPDMYLFIEEGLRGGTSMISNRFSEANNPYVPDYDSTQENSYVMYFDANNLYGWAISQSLPTGEFDWLTEEEIADLEIANVADDNEEGYILEVNLYYPSDLALNYMIFTITL